MPSPSTRILGRKRFMLISRPPADNQVRIAVGEGRLKVAWSHVVFVVDGAHLVIRDAHQAALRIEEFPRENRSPRRPGLRRRTHRPTPRRPYSRRQSVLDYLAFAARLWMKSIIAWGSQNIIVCGQADVRLGISHGQSRAVASYTCFVLALVNRRRRQCSLYPTSIVARVLKFAFCTDLDELTLANFRLVQYYACNSLKFHDLQRYRNVASYCRWKLLASSCDRLPLNKEISGENDSMSFRSSSST